MLLGQEGRLGAGGAKGLIRRYNANHNINRYSVLDTERESREVRRNFPSSDIGFSWDADCWNDKQQDTGTVGERDSDP